MTEEVIDARIAKETNPTRVFAGEAFNIDVPITDANGDPIDLTGWTVGPGALTHRGATVQVIENVSGNGTNLEVRDTILDTLRERNTLDRYYLFKCPLLPPGGYPNAIARIRILVDTKK